MGVGGWEDELKNKINLRFVMIFSFPQHSLFSNFLMCGKSDSCGIFVFMLFNLYFSQFFFVI